MAILPPERQLDAGVDHRYIRVSRLIELLQQLPADADLMVNAIGNLTIVEHYASLQRRKLGYLELGQEQFHAVDELDDDL